MVSLHGSECQSTRRAEEASQEVAPSPSSLKSAACCSSNRIPRRFRDVYSVVTRDRPRSYWARAHLEATDLDSPRSFEIPYRLLLFPIHRDLQIPPLRDRWHVNDPNVLGIRGISREQVG